MLIPRIALAAEPLGLAGFISMAGLTRPLDETILRQMTYLYGLAGGAVSDEDKKQLDGIRADIARIKALTPADRARQSGSSAPCRPTGSTSGLRPAGVRQVGPKPFLVLQGGRDYQVTTEDFENWKAALGPRKDVEFQLYPKLNHLFFEGQGLPTPDEYTAAHAPWPNMWSRTSRPSSKNGDKISISQ